MTSIEHPHIVDTAPKEAFVAEGLPLASLDSSFIELLPMAAYICAAPTGALVRYNHHAAELWGWGSGFTEERERCGEALRLFSPDGEPIAHRDTPVAEVLRSGIRVHDLAAIIEQPDGVRLRVLISVDPMHDIDRNIVGAVSLIQIAAPAPHTKPHTKSEPPSRQLWLHRLLEKLPAAAYTCNSDGLITCFNEQAVALWGRTPTLNDPVDRYCGSFKLFTDEGEALAHEHCWMALALKTNRDYLGREVVIERPDGSRLTALAYASPIETDSGHFDGAVNVLVNISDRKRLEQETRQLLSELHRERARLIEIFDRSPTFMAVLRGPEHVFERVNDRYRRLIGNRDCIGKSVEDVLPEAKNQGYLEILDRVYRTGRPFTSEGMSISLHSTPDQPPQELLLEFLYEPLPADNHSAPGILVLGIDLTERKKAEADLALMTEESERQRRLYETILSGTPDFVYVFNLDHRFVYANQALLDMWGKSWTESIGKNCLQLGYPVWHAEMHGREIDQVIASKLPIRGQVPFSGTSGKRIYEYIFVPVLGANGEVEAVAGTTRDITEHNDMEQELQKRAQQLANSDKKKDEFIAMLAHELRNPLAPIRNGIQLIERAAHDEVDLGEVRAMMDRQLQHMVRLIDDLLDISRLSRNKLSLQTAPVALTEVLDNAVEAMRPTIEAANHTLEISLPDEPVIVNADLTRLAQVFGNLLSNSSKYTQPGGQIWLTATYEGDEAIVTVRDTGIGIPAEGLSQLFEMFTQVHNSSEHSASGLGIGLALVKSLVEMHGGSVSVASEGSNLGSTFSVKLPILREIPLPRPTSRSSGRPRLRHSRRILVVDDNRDSCSSMAMLFQLLGNEVCEAYDGVEAVTQTKIFKPDLVLMDVGMPRLNGYEATRSIREQPWGQEVIIIAVTGWGQEKDRAESQEAGFDGHLVKPVSLSDLEQLLALQESAAES